MNERQKLLSFLTECKVIGFDLDDTLWDNKPVIQAAVDQMFSFLDSELTDHSINNIESVYTYEVEKRVNEDPLRYHDMTLLRKESLLDLCRYFNAPEKLADQAWDVFYEHRQMFTPYDDAFKLLKFLSEKFKLMVISNGNANLQVANMEQYFDCHWQAGINGRAKPDPDMLTKALAKYKIERSQFLYVGDNINIDMRFVINGRARGVLIPSKRNEDVCFSLTDKMKSSFVTMESLSEFYAVAKDI
ncbi:HAD-IA family hydrolase [Pleionea sediminis]|uniref:HAD-IA family hydrolase n=1 Tax=Pleionea sediminis TaxID=2569479 RepID=UPI0011872DA4|nr:HAD-IA family hydrolase [Pleionea sediminis]